MKRKVGREPLGHTNDLAAERAQLELDRLVLYPALRVEDPSGEADGNDVRDGPAPSARAEYSMVLIACRPCVPAALITHRATVLNEPGGRVVCRFHARDLHLVMGPPEPGVPVPFRVLLDGQPPGADHGVDVDDQGNGTLSEQRLHQLIRQNGDIGDRTFEITFLDSGAQAFAFTFG